MADTSELMRAERQAFIELLETLTPDEWAAQSLCSAWTVQDVAAHVAWSPVVRPGQAVRELVRSGLRINKMNADAARRWSQRGPAAILQQMRSNMQTGATPVGTGPELGLADAVIHQLDIRRPLGRPRKIPEEAFVAVADLQTGLRWPSTIVVGGSVRKRLEGIRLVADDTSWTFGDGEEVCGSREALILMLTGRPVHQGELTGPGLSRLRAQGLRMTS